MSDALTVNEITHDPPAGYVPVRVCTLRGSHADSVDLFMQYEPASQPRLYCKAGSRPEEHQFDELAATGVENLYVRSGDFRVFSNDLLESLDSILQQPVIPAAEKFAALQQAVAVAIEQTLRFVDCSKFRALAERVGNDVVSMIANTDILPRELFRLARHDFNTFTHVTNVASYSVILAQKLGINDHQELQKIASGAMLHDLGKRFIPASVLSKSGPLTPDERAIVETHPRLGYIELCENDGFDFGQLMMVYQHHERVDGTGYPVCLPQSEIHPWARILSIVDVFDTMTAKRPNRQPDSPEKVLEYQRQQAGTHFDGEFVEMLDISHDQSLMQLAWDKVELKPSLPEEMKDFFDQHGAMRARPGCRRAYNRFYLRGKAILQRHEAYLGVFTADASRQGMRFISPVQLLPKERCRIRLPKTKEFQIEIVRCRRIAENCYECGAMFVLGSLS